MSKEIVLLWFPKIRGAHPMAWREEAPGRSVEMDFATIRRHAQLAERGKFHGVFFADGVSIGFHSDISMDALSRTAKGTLWEPVTLLSALSACTTHIGLLGTISTTYSQPYNVARLFASLDHISGGRAGWNVVTTNDPTSGRNFGLEEYMVASERYERSQEFFDVVAGLWDSWEDDAFLRDKVSGRYFDPAKLHALNHRGKYLSVAGPLNIARPPQGHPVIAQAGSSAPGQAFASRNADLVFTMHADIERARKFREDVRAQAAGHGRDPDHVKVVPLTVLSVGHSMAHAEDKLARLDELMDPVLGMEMLNGVLDADLSGYPLDGPVPELPEAQIASKTGQKYFLDMARRDNLTIRQLMQVNARISAIPGTAASIADRMEEWVEEGAADGFTIELANDADSLPIFVEEVIPEL